MTTLGLLEDLTRRGVVLTAEADKLRYKAPKGTITPALRDLIAQHRTALLQALGSADGPGLQQTSNKRPTAGSPSAALDQAAGQVAALEAELEALLGELGQVAGSWADLPAYRRFCDLERQWLDLRAELLSAYAIGSELFSRPGQRADLASQAGDPALVSGHGHQVTQDEADEGATRGQQKGNQGPALVSPDELVRTQDEADQVTRRAQRDPQRARLDQLLQWPKEGGLTPAEVAEVRALAQACGVAVRLERLDLADLAAGWHEVTYVT